MGKTGSGKSSLVNAIFGEQFAKTGVGVPVTKHLEKYAPQDKPVVVYDTKVHTTHFMDASSNSWEKGIGTRLIGGIHS